MMVGQTCLECVYGPNGLQWCGCPERMDDWSLNQPSPCGEPLSSAPDYRHEYHFKMTGRETSVRTHTPSKEKK